MKTYQPILEEQAFSQSRFTVKIPYPVQAGVATVLTGGQQEDMVIWLNAPVDMRRLKAGKYTRLAYIDVSMHELELEFKQYGQDQVNQFTIRCKARCAAADPAQVYRAYITDAADVLRGMIEHDSSLLAQAFSMEDSRALQEELQHKFGRNEIIETGLRFSQCQFYVEIDDQYRKFKAQKVKITQANDLAGMPVNDFTGVFADVLDGRLSLDGAVERLKGKDAQRFNEGLRRLQDKKALLKELVEEDMLDEQQARAKLESAIAGEAESLGLQAGSAAQPAPVEKSVPALSEEDLFQGFEEEEQERGAAASIGNER